MFLILGGSGYVGGAFRKYLQQKDIPFEVISRCDVNYADEKSLLQLIRSRRPEFLINAAGYTGRPNVDACEVHRTECLQGNAVLPGVVRSACEQANLPWGHVSSGCIFTGSKPDGSGFSELDPPNFSFRHVQHGLQGIQQTQSVRLCRGGCLKRRAVILQRRVSDRCAVDFQAVFLNLQLTPALPNTLFYLVFKQHIRSSLPLKCDQGSPIDVSFINLIQGRGKTDTRGIHRAARVVRQTFSPLKRNIQGRFQGIGSDFHLPARIHHLCTNVH